MFFEEDPFDSEEDDPLNSGSLESCLWELEGFISLHYDREVRQYAKIFKQDFLAKTESMKTGEWANTNEIERLKAKIEGFKVDKEAAIVKRILLEKYGKTLPVRRKADYLDEHWEPEMKRQKADEGGHEWFALKE